MKIINTQIIALAAVVLVLAAGRSQADDTGELTMTLITNPDAELPEAVTKILELPAAASAAGMDNSAKGQDAANGARESRDKGLENAAEARERGSEFGQDMADSARENRENRGRSSPPSPHAPPSPPNGPPGGPPQG